MKRVVAVAADSWHNLALREDGRVVAWGSYLQWHPTQWDPIYIPMPVPADL